MVRSLLINSPINYMGNKYVLLDKLIPLFPNKKYFIDLFTGSGSVYMNVADKYEKVLANDIIKDLIEIHRNLSDVNFIEKAKTYSINTKQSQEYYLWLRDEYNKTNSPEMLLALIWSCNSNMMRFNNDFKFNQTWGKRCYNKNTEKKLNQYLEKSYDNLIFTSEDFYVIGMKAGSNCFVYLDPPYHNSLAGFNAYWSGKNEKDLIKLLEYYIENDIKFGISGVINGKPNQIYDYLADKDLQIHWFGDLYQKISKVDKVNKEYYITNSR